jgi:hypothetical protein
MTGRRNPRHKRKRVYRRALKVGRGAVKKRQRKRVNKRRNR